jgi:hypothetical protein
MKRFLVVFILFFVAVHFTLGQDLWRRHRYEVTAGFGSTQFFGDVGGFSKKVNILGFRDISFKQTSFNFNLGAKYRILNDLNVRLGLNYGKFRATDDRGSNESRGFDARTTIYEPTVIAEYYFIKSNLGESYLFNAGRGHIAGNYIPALDFYTFLGIGGLSYNVDRNAKLAAAGFKSSGFTAVIPGGVGVNLLFRPEINFGLELGGRYAFTDYLDSYTSQHSSSNDVYYFLNVTFTYKIKTDDNGVPSFFSKRRF